MGKTKKFVKQPKKISKTRNTVNKKLMEFLYNKKDEGASVEDILNALVGEKGTKMRTLFEKRMVARMKEEQAGQAEEDLAKPVASRNQRNKYKKIAKANADQKKQYPSRARRKREDKQEIVDTLD